MKWTFANLSDWDCRQRRGSWKGGRSLKRFISRFWPCTTIIPNEMGKREIERRKEDGGWDRKCPFKGRTALRLASPSLPPSLPSTETATTPISLKEMFIAEHGMRGLQHSCFLFIKVNKKSSSVPQSKSRCFFVCNFPPSRPHENDLASAAGRGSEACVESDKWRKFVPHGA